MCIAVHMMGIPLQAWTCAAVLGIFNIYLLKTIATYDSDRQSWLEEEEAQPASMLVSSQTRRICEALTDLFSSALQRRQALMGASGPRALVKNFKVFRIALFACLGGVLYGYNQGMFSGILAMPSFGKRELTHERCLRAEY
jgi:hypothetical protein